MMRALLAESLRRNRVLAILAIAHFALFVILAPAAFIDATQIQGISRWIKPMKFALSISIYLMTMAWVLSMLEGRRRAVAILTSVIAFVMTVEMVLIMMQAARGVRSHFNFATPFDKLVFDVMGGMIFANTLAVVVVLFLFLSRQGSVPPAVLSGIRLGLLIFIVASLVGGVIVQRGGHSVGAHDGGPGLPFVNWSTGGGDLRVAHFFGMHALQALPLFGWFLDRKNVNGSRRWVQLAAAVLLLVTFGLLAQALAGVPLLRF